MKKISFCYYGAGVELLYWEWFWYWRVFFEDRKHCHGPSCLCVVCRFFLLALCGLFRQILSRSTFSSIKMQEKKVACIKLLSRVLIWTLFLFFEGEWHTWSGMEKVSKNSEFFWSFSLDQRWNDRAIQVWAF